MILDFRLKTFDSILLTQKELYHNRTPVVTLAYTLLLLIVVINLFTVYYVFGIGFNIDCI
jgi:hypothetical protein